MSEIIAATFATRDRIEIDINHSTYLAAPRGERSDAAGWIVEMQARDDGLWGRVEWTPEGNALVAGKSYRGISPVIVHDPSKKITGLANASLVNRPNLRGLTALHSEEMEKQMNWMEYLAKLLGLDAEATEEDVKAAIEAKFKVDADEAMPALQAQMSEIGTALGLAKDADGVAILAAVQAGGSATPTEITALQSEIATLSGQVTALTTGSARTAATTYVDGEIKRGRMGLKPVRDRFISMHMADAENATALIEAMPVNGGSTTTILPPAPTDGSIALNAEQIAVARTLGLSKEDYAAQLKAMSANEEAL
tara:strand:- start:549 stop:1478 length:930 start_codon:yes stop_codon:yes gene_type:complete